MWFICILFHFTSADTAKTVNDWQAAALARIASKTPPLVAEDIHDFVASELEYNPVLRKDFVEKVSRVGLSIYSDLESIETVVHSIYSDRRYIIIGPIFRNIFPCGRRKFGLCPLRKLFSF